MSNPAGGHVTRWTEESRQLGSTISISMREQIIRMMRHKVVTFLIKIIDHTCTLQIEILTNVNNTVFKRITGSNWTM